MILRRGLPAAALPVAALAAALTVALGVALPGSDVSGFRDSAGLVAAVGLVLVAAAARPSWTLGVGISLSVFNSHWVDMGIPFSVDRVLIVVGCLTALANEVRAHGWGRLRSEPIHWLLAVAAAYALVSAIIAGTLDDRAARFALLDRYALLPMAVFFVAPYAFREERDRRVLLGMLVAVGAYLGVDALLETTGPRSLLFPAYIDDPTLGTHFERARGPFLEAAANGMALLYCGVAAVMAVAIWRGRRWRTFAVGVAGLCALGVLFTVTRAAWLGAIIAVLAALMATRQTRRLIAPVVLVGLVMVLVALAVIPGFQGKAQDRSDSKLPLWDRQNSNAAALRMIDARPLLGFGWGRFASESLDYYVMNPNYPLRGVRDVHNIFISNAVELGLIGALLWAAALFGAVGGAIFKRGPPELRIWKIGLVALFADWLTLAQTTPLSFSMLTLVLWVWAGIARGTPEQRAT
jgi:O-antigen ligase